MAVAGRQMFSSNIKKTSRYFKSSGEIRDLVAGFFLVIYIETAGVIEEGSEYMQGKGRRCCLGDGIDSCQCRTTDLATG